MKPLLILGAGAFALETLDIAEASRTDALKPIVERHGAKIKFEAGLGDATNDRLLGALTAEQLRDLYSDPEFLAATKVLGAMDLEPKL